VFASVIHPNNYPSQSVLEALAYGNALLLSDTGTSLERFLDGNGVGCSLDENEMLQALGRLTSDQLRLQEMSKRSRQLVATRYDKSVYLNHINSLYE
jgi:glycosyltransferase involved in cell wall biosynthesis